MTERKLPLYLSPLICAVSTTLRNSFKSCSPKITFMLSMESLISASLVQPGIGTMRSYWARNQLRQIWAGVHCLRSAITHRIAVFRPSKNYIPSVGLAVVLIDDLKFSKAFLPDLEIVSPFSFCQCKYRTSLPLYCAVHACILWIQDFCQVIHMPWLVRLRFC